MKTLAIGFCEAKDNEAGHGKAIANLLGIEHTQLYVFQADCPVLIPRLTTLYGEPFADPSQMPTFLVSQLGRRKAKVALSGDAGDEAFCSFRTTKSQLHGGACGAIRLSCAIL